MHVYEFFAENEEDTKTANEPKKTQPKGKKERFNPRKRDGKSNFTHPWLSSTLRFHSGQILGIDFSPNGKYLITCSDGKKKLQLTGTLLQKE